MAKRTPTPKATAADLHTTPVQEAVAMNASNPQPLPPVVKSSGKAKAKPNTVRDDEPLAADSDTTVTLASEPSLPDSTHDVVLAQANTASTSSSSPASVGEDLLRQAGPVPTKTAAAQDTGFFSTSWGMPVAIGAGALALAGGGGGGGSGGGNNEQPKPSADTTTFSIVPYAGPFTKGTGNVTATLSKVSADGKTITDISTTNVVKTDGSLSFSPNTADLVLAPGEYLQVKLVDSNGAAANFGDEAQQGPVNLGADLITLLSTVPTAGSAIAVTQLTTAAALQFKEVLAGLASPTPAEIKKAIEDSNNAVAQAFGIQTSLTNSNPADSPSYKKALGLISGYAKSIDPNNTTESNTSAVLSVLKNAVFANSPDVTVKTIFQTGLDQLPSDYTNPTGNSTFVFASLELTDTYTLTPTLKGDVPTVNLVNYSDGLSFKINPSTGTHVGDQATLTFTEGSSTFTYVYTFKGDGIYSKAPGDEVTLPETFTIPRYSNINPSKLTEYKDATGNSLLPYAPGSSLPDGKTHTYKVDLTIGTTDIGKGLSSLAINTASVTLKSPGFKADVFNSGDDITVSVSLSQNVQWFNNNPTGNGDPTLTLQVVGGDGTKNILLPLLTSGTSDVSGSFKPTNILTFKISAGADALKLLNGTIQIPAAAIQFPSTTSIMDGPGNKKTQAWFNELVTTELTPLLRIDTVPPSDATLATTDAHPAGSDASYGDLSSTDLLTNNNQLPVQITVVDPTLTGPNAKVRLYWSKSETDLSPMALGTKNVTDNVVSFTSADYTEIKAGLEQGTYIGGSSGVYFRGEPFFLFAKLVDEAGNEAERYSAPLKVFLDITAPDTPTLDLTEDTGLSTLPGGLTTDNVTSVVRPPIKIIGEKGSKVALYDDIGNDGKLDEGELLVTDHLSTTLIDGQYSFTWSPLTTDLPPGVHHFKAILTDVAGNSSTAGALDVEILTPLTTKPSLGFTNPSSFVYNTVSADAKTITATVTYEREMYVVDTSGLYLTLTLGGAGNSRRANYSGVSTSDGKTTLTFTYTLGSGDIGLLGPVNISGVYGAKDALQDKAGNPAPESATAIVDTTTLPLIDTQAPDKPIISIKTTQAGLASVTTDGFFAIKAAADAFVTVTFKNIEPLSKPSQTVSVTVNGNGDQAVPVKLDELTLKQVTALGQGKIQVTAEAKDLVGNTLGPTAALPANTFTLDSVAPWVTSVAEAPNDTVTNQNIVFTVQFSEGLANVPAKTDFKVVDDLGTIASVAAVSGSTTSYRVTVKPNLGKVGAVQLAFAEGYKLQDDAGNQVVDKDGWFGKTTQRIDTQAPFVTAVTSSIKEGTVANGDPFDFIVTFNEAMGTAAIGNQPLTPSNFLVTHGKVTAVAPVVTTDGSVKYKVSVTPISGLDKGTDGNYPKMELSLVASTPDNISSFVMDALGNLASDAPLSTGGLGGFQSVDNVGPLAPTITRIKTDVNLATAQAGAVAITAEDGATVTVTFTNTDLVSKPSQTVVVSGKGADSPVLVQLDLPPNSGQVAALGQGKIQVTAVAKDAAQNASSPQVVDAAFTLDTLAPTVSISSNTPQLKLGEAATITFTFSEDPGTSFDASDVTVTGGTLGAIQGISGLTRTATFTADQPGVSGRQASITVKANSYTDAALNEGAGASSSTTSFILVDTVAPTITGFTSTTTNGIYGIGSVITLRATASEDVAAGATLNVKLNNGSTQAVTLTRHATNASLFEGTYTVAAGDTTTASLQVLSFTTSGTDIVGNPITTGMPSSNLATGLVINGIAPPAPTSFVLSSSSDNGLAGDYITTQTTPSFDFKGLVIGSTVKIYNGKDLLHSFVATSMEMSNIQLPSALKVGSYDTTNFKAVQANAIGNDSLAAFLPKTLQIQALPAIPAPLTGLTLDPVLDAQNEAQYKAGITPSTLSLDNMTFVSTPTFQFSGGTVGNKALLFRDVGATKGVYDSGDTYLGQVTISSTGVQSISVDAANALANTPYPSEGYTDIKVVQQDALGQTSAASNAALGPAGIDRAGQGVIILNSDATSATSLGELTSLMLADSTPVSSNANTLTFAVRGVTVPGAKVVITATLNDTDTVTLPAAVPTAGGTTLVVDVSGINGTLTDFTAKQTWAGLTSTTPIDNTGKLVPIVLDHVAPTVAISSPNITSTSLLGQGETPVIQFKFSEPVSDTADELLNKITVTSGSITGLVKSGSDDTLWTATYQGVPGNTAPAYIFVGSGTFQDTAGNLNTDGADSKNLLTLQFRPINHAPSAMSKTFKVNEDAPTTFKKDDFGFADANDSPANDFMNVIITALPEKGTLTLNGVAITDVGATGKSIAVADIPLLVYTPAPNESNASGYATIKFKVQDSGGDANTGIDKSAEAAFTFDVASVNDAPTGTDATITVSEDGNQALTVANFGFNDVDGNNLQSVKITSLSVPGTLMRGTTAVLVNDVISVSDINSGNLKFKPALNANGNNYATIGFQVTDDGGTANGGVATSTTTNTLTVNVTPVNDAPTGANKTFTVDEDGSKTLTVDDFGFNDVDGNNLLSVKITSLSVAGTLMLGTTAVLVNDVISASDITNGNLKFTPVHDANGNNYVTIGFQVTDDGSTTNPGDANTSVTTNTMAFNVTPVNDAPTGNVILGGYTAGTAPKVGATLTATTSSDFADADGISGTNAIHYQWYVTDRDTQIDTVITGATGSSFTLTNAQMGKAITVKATYTDNGGKLEEVSTAIDIATSAPTATLPVQLPETIALSGLSFHSLGTYTKAEAATGAQLMLGHDGVYLLDVDGNNVIDADDRTTYAQGLDSTGSITFAGLKFTLLKADSSTWDQLASYTDWPAGDTKGASGVTGNDYWTSTVGTLSPGSSTPAHVVFNTALGTYVAPDNGTLGSPTRLHYNAFKVEAAAVIPA